MTRLFLLVAFAVALATGCTGTAGGRTFEFEAAAGGAPEATGGALRFSTPRGYEVELTRAVLHVGAVYMNELLPVSNANTDECLSEGRYTAQVTRGLDVNLLDGRPQKFPRLGVATSAPSRAGEVWLTGGDVYAEEDSTPILDLAGIAMRGGATFPFQGRITIGANRKRPPPTPAQPGANPLCRERIVSPIPLSIEPAEGGSLSLSIDPKKLFLAVEFADLRQFSSDPPLYGFQDEAGDGPSVALFAALRSAPLYDFQWKVQP